MIDLREISKTYDGKKKIINEINLEIKKSEFIALCGKSGEGKSTILNIIGLLDKPSSGQYFFDEILVSELNSAKLARMRNEYIGFIFQSYYLIQNLSVLDNILLPFLYTKNPHSKNIITIVDRLMTELGINEIKNKNVELLSGGEKQRTAIARALSINPSIIIADEPTGNLDSENTNIIMNILKKENNEGKTIIIVTHDMDVAKHADKIYFLEDGAVSLL